MSLSHIAERHIDWQWLYITLNI